MLRPNDVKTSIVKILIPCLEWAMAIYAIYFATFRGFEELPLSWTFNASADLICIFINLFLIMGILLGNIVVDQRYSEFLLICHANFLSLFMDYCSWMMDGFVTSRTILLFINTTLYISNLCLTAAYARFIVDTVADVINRKKYYLIIYLLLAISVFTRILNIKYGYFFTVSDSAVYARGPYQFLSYLYTVFIQFFVIALLIKSNVSRLQKMTIFAFVIFPFAAAVVSIFVYGLSLMYACVLVSIVMMYSAFFVELEENNDKIIEDFEKYISNDIVQKIVNNPSSKLVEGRRYKATVLISDMRGYTAVSEFMNPNDLIDMLNHYYEVITDIIHEYGGVVTEFLGDGLLCVFGAPKENDEHADAAVAAAIKIQQASETINKWNAEHGYPEVYTGIGINTGSIVMGSLGNEKHAKYTAVGQTVDRVFEIESCSIGGQTLISSSCLRNIKNPVKTRFLVDYSSNPSELVKIKIYEVTAIEGKYGLAFSNVVNRPDELPEALDSEFCVLDGKSVKKQMLPCSIVALSDKAAVFESNHNISILDNIELRIAKDKLVFAKVEEINDDNIFAVFTSKMIE